MKKIFISLIVLTGVFIFTDCKKPEPPEPEIPTVGDTTSPKITLPSTSVLLLKLGDEADALKGVKATDDIDGDITKNIKLLTNLDIVREVDLVYVVSDAAGNKDTATRKARIRSDALYGFFWLKYNTVGESKDTTQIRDEVSIVEKLGDPLQLQVKGLHQNREDAVIPFEPDPDNDYCMRALSGHKIYDIFGKNDNQTRYNFEGRLFYQKTAAGKYQVVSFSYELISTSGRDTARYETFYCVPQ
jgi:hypothetical protein